MRIAVGGFMHESNTFSPRPTRLDDFRDASFHEGDALVPVWRDAHQEMGGFLQGARDFGFEAVPTVMAWATPSGPVEDDVFDLVVDRIARTCREPGIDGLLLALHGAMVSRSFPDGDGEVLRRLREALGPDRPLICTLDYHANVSPEMARHASALIGYQTYPHIDQRDVGLRAAALARRAVLGEVRPVCAVAKPPLILNLLAQETDREPLKSLLAMAREVESRPGVLSVSLMAGFPYADVAEMGPSVLAVTDGNAALAQEIADDFASRLWDLRHEFDVRRPDAEEAVRQAIESEARPVVLVDIGDNIGGGTPGDGTLILSELIRQGARDAVVAIHDPAAVEAARAVGVGGTFEHEVGGRTLSELYGPPQDVRGVVRSLHDGRWVEELPRHGGLRHNDQGRTAVVELPGPIHLVLNSLRTPPFSLGQITSLGIEASSQSILVVKAAVAYKAAYTPIAGQILEVNTPGLTALDPAHFDYRHIRRPVFPLDRS